MAARSVQLFAWVIPSVTGCFAHVAIDNPDIHGVLMIDGRPAAGFRVLLRSGPLWGATKTVPCDVPATENTTLEYTTGSDGEFSFAKREHTEGRSMIPSMDRSFSWRLCAAAPEGPVIVLGCDHGMGAAIPKKYRCDIDTTSHVAHCTEPPAQPPLVCPD